MPESQEPDYEEALARLVERYQHLAARLAVVRDSEAGEALREDLRAVLDELWPLLEALVDRLAWGWVDRYAGELGGSRGTRDTHASVMTSMCLHVLDTLATSPITPRPPIGPLLKRIARNRMVDEFRHRQRHSPDQPAPPRAAGAEPRPVLRPLSLDEALQGDHPVLSVDLAVELDDRLYQAECAEAIEQYWQLRLSPDERRIVDARLVDPPTPYEVIAAMFTPPWTTAAVRKRYSRLIADTRNHLRALDLLPDLQAEV